MAVSQEAIRYNAAQKMFWAALSVVVARLFGGLGVITTVHALRGLAALAVVLLHTNYLFFGAISSQFQAVSIFFVISGFIVAYITEHGTENFLIRRVFRVLPIYWLVTIFALIWYPLGQFSWLALVFSDPAQAILQVEGALFNPDFFPYVLKNLLMIPYPDPSSGAYTLFVYPAWTLAIECFFYLLFGVLAMLGRKPALIVISAFFVGCNLFRILGDGHGVLGFYGKQESLYIVSGFGVYWLWKRSDKVAELPRILFKILALIVAALVFASNVPLAYSQTSPVWNNFLQYTWHILPPVVVLTALMMHTAGIRCNFRVIVFLGDISYALYLVHTIVLTTFDRYASVYPFLEFRHNFKGVVLAVAVSCLVAWVLHVGFEKPIIRFGKRFIREKKVIAPTAVAS
ncbi:acyltransferase [Cupriavidus sp.]|uniref:acyltransferase family protein n=1 Tax=Cupriavidus sp. TaxID=1873897 RepID=UPI0028BE6BFE|nr:acyltransferase [Cupriavidus sp.]